jgi:hypothetical protein
MAAGVVVVFFAWCLVTNYGLCHNSNSSFDWQLQGWAARVGGQVIVSSMDLRELPLDLKLASLSILPHPSIKLQLRHHVCCCKSPTASWPADRGGGLKNVHFSPILCADHHHIFWLVDWQYEVVMGLLLLLLCMVLERIRSGLLGGNDWMSGHLVDVRPDN